MRIEKCKFVITWIDHVLYDFEIDICKLVSPVVNLEYGLAVFLVAIITMTWQTHEKVFG